ncbi:IS4 family transposase [Candidatus Saccharibacteria bacterium]|nr:IS4 family transposase [Candidatus Saccharibacteria bacterium]NIW80894.1 IS4 family transposase [Calditrichia bacterium]
MRAIKLLHKILLNSAPNIHRVRLAALMAGVESLLSGSFLTVTALGRRLNSQALTKHNIKRMDRLLSNPHLYNERADLYRALCHHLIGNQSQPVVLVDWTDIVERERLMLIRAALAVDGRAIPIYEGVYPLKQYNAPRTHRKFLTELKALLPPDCRPVIVTDAGFRGPWFKAVEQLGWHWIGRIRNCVNYRLHSRYQWRRTEDLYYRANRKIRYLGPAELSSRHPYDCYLYLYKKPRQGRKANRSVVHSVRHSNCCYFRKQQKDPWLIATNLSPEDFSPKRIIHLYGKRMQIEECFRDLKSDRFGFGFTLTRSKNTSRLNILLLIAALATLCLWWVGIYAKQQNWQRHFQANSIKNKNVLSIPFLAMAILSRNDYVITMTEFIGALHALTEYIYEQNNG